MRTNKLSWLLITMIILVAVAGCSSKEAAPESSEADTLVQVLPADRGEMAVPLADGTLPCGLAEIKWGYQVFQMKDFPACQASMPNLTVYCLNSEARWTETDLVNISVSADANTITLESQREGICGVFPTR